MPILIDQKHEWFAKLQNTVNLLYEAVRKTEMNIKEIETKYNKRGYSPSGTNPEIISADDLTGSIFDGLAPNDIADAMVSLKAIVTGIDALFNGNDGTNVFKVSR